MIRIRKCKTERCGHDPNSFQPSNPLFRSTDFFFVFVLSCTSNKKHRTQPLKDVVLVKLVILLVVCNPEFHCPILDAVARPSSEPYNYDLLPSNSRPPERSFHLIFYVHNVIQVGILLTFLGYMNLFVIL